MMIRYIVVFVLGICLLSCNNNDNNRNSPPKKPKKSIAKPTQTKNKIVKQSQNIPKAHLETANRLISDTKVQEIDNVDVSKVYKMRCATCHGLKGNMDINGAKDLTKATLSLQESVAQIYFGKGVMLPHRNILSEAEIVAVAKYVEKEFRK